MGRPVTSAKRTWPQTAEHSERRGLAHGGITAPMPFLSETRPRSYGRYAGETNPERFARFFHPDDEDGSLVAQHHGDHNRLGFALQLGTVRLLGAFHTEPTDVPEGVAAYAAARRACGPLAGSLAGYSRRQPTHNEHAREIPRAYGNTNLGEGPERFRLIRSLYGRAWVYAERPSVLFDPATTRTLPHPRTCSFTKKPTESATCDRVCGASPRITERVFGGPGDLATTSIP